MKKIFSVLYSWKLRRCRSSLYKHSYRSLPSKCSIARYFESLTFMVW